MIKKESPLWYTDELKLINKQIWVPTHNLVEKNNDIINKFNSKIIEFSSFKNTLANKFFNHIIKKNDNTWNRFNFLHKKIAGEVLTLCNWRNFYKKEYMKHMNNFDEAYLNSQEYLQDPIIINLKRLSLQCSQQIDKISYEYKLLIESFEMIVKNNDPKIKVININNFNRQYNIINKNFITKCKKYINTDKKKEKYIAATYKNHLNDVSVLNNFINDPKIKEFNKQNLNLNAKHYKAIENRKNAIEMINKSIHTYRTKVKFNKTQTQIILKWMTEAETLYNRCVKLFRNDEIRVKKKLSKLFPSNFIDGKLFMFRKYYPRKKPAPDSILAYVIKVFYDNLASNYAAIENGTKKQFTMNFINCRENRTVTITKNSIGKKGIYGNLLGKNNNTIGRKNNKIDVNNIACDCKLTYNTTTKNFYLHIPQYVNCKPTDNTKKPICALDPGEKVFMTYYSLDDYGFIGNDVRVPILKIEEKIKKYQRLLVQTTVNGQKVNKKNKWGKPIKRGKIKKKIKLLYQKIKGIVNELHKKTANFLCRNYNIILIPVFNTQQMISNGSSIKETKIASKKKFTEVRNAIKEEHKNNLPLMKRELKTYKRASRLSGRVKFVLNQQSHFTFRQHLLNKAKEYGCLCKVVTEEFTSQFCSNCGFIDKSFIGRIKVCTHCGHEIHRDVNGARSILLKNISDVIEG
jgi:hypothetical protein